MPDTAIEVPYPGPEMTGVEDLDARLTELRNSRDYHTTESYKCQTEIDKIILSRVAPDIKKGDWWRLDLGDDDYQIFCVDSVRRSTSGVFIDPHTLASIHEDSDDWTIRDIAIESDPSPLTITVNQLKSGALKKSSRQEFLSETRRVYNEIVAMLPEPVDQNQLKLNI